MGPVVVVPRFESWQYTMYRPMGLVSIVKSAMRFLPQCFLSRRNKVKRLILRFDTRRIYSNAKMMKRLPKTGLLVQRVNVGSIKCVPCTMNLSTTKKNMFARRVSRSPCQPAKAHRMTMLAPTTSAKETFYTFVSGSGTPIPMNEIGNQGPLSL